MRKLLSCFLSIVLVQFAPVSLALDSEKLPVQCTLAPFDMAMGADRLKQRRRYTQVKNKSSSMSALLDCGVGSPLNGIFVTDHRSRVKVRKSGVFSGRLSGDFVLYSATIEEYMSGQVGEEVADGELHAHVDGLMLVGEDGRPVLDEAAKVITISETIDGKWELEGVSIEHGKGVFVLPMDFSDYDPFGGLMSGTIMMDDDDDDDDD